jgi:ligand-binding sensor domain-containing protein
LFVLGCIGLVTAARLWAQTPDIKFEHYSLELGLSQSSVFSIVQDRRGFLWIGTFDGLNRFDGYSFRIYRHIPFDSLSLSDNFIHCGFTDSRGMLWFGTDRGLNRFEPETGSFVYMLPSASGAGGLSGSVVNCITEDPMTPGVLWVGTDRGLDRVDVRRDPGDISTDSALHGVGIRDMVWDVRGALWIGTEDMGLYRLDAAGALRAMGAASGIRGVRAVHASRSGDVWIASDRGLHVFHGGDAPAIPVCPEVFAAPAKRPTIHSILETRDGRLWVGTETGIYLLNGDRTACFVYQHDPLRHNSLSADYVNTLFEDRAGNVWVGTAFGGLNKFSPRMRAFRHYASGASAKTDLSNAYVYPILERSDGSIWMGTYGGGIAELDPSASTLRVRTVSPGTPPQDRAGPFSRVGLGAPGGPFFCLPKRKDQRKGQPWKKCREATLADGGAKQAPESCGSG